MPSIIEFLNTFRDGVTASELTDKLQELTAAVQSTGLQGELTWKIKITPASKASHADKVIIRDDIALKLPPVGRSEDFFWITDDADLSRKHPRQYNLPLRDASGDQPKQFKEVSNG